MTEQQKKWDLRFLTLAGIISGWSKDPSTKCGAVIVSPDRRQLAMGYNGFPQNMRDDDALYQDREIKYSRVIHAEMNAILNSTHPVTGHTLYVWPFMTCDRCAVHVIQAGIARVVAPHCSTEQWDRWGKSFEAAIYAYEEAGVLSTIYMPKDINNG